MRNIALRMQNQSLSKAFYTWKENVHGPQEAPIAPFTTLANGFGPGLTARARLSNATKQAPDEDRIMQVVHAIHTTVRQLAASQTSCEQSIADLSRRFSHFEHGRQAETGAERGRSSDTQPPAPRGGQRGRNHDGHASAGDDEGGREGESEAKEGAGE